MADYTVGCGVQCKRIFRLFGVFIISRLSEEACSLASFYIHDMDGCRVWGCHLRCYIECESVIYCSYVSRTFRFIHEAEIVVRTRAKLVCVGCTVYVCASTIRILTVSFELHFCAWPPINRSNTEGRETDDFGCDTSAGCGVLTANHTIEISSDGCKCLMQCLSFANNNSSTWNAFSYAKYKSYAD